MATHTQLPIYKVAYDMLDVVTDLVKNMPRDFKQSIGGKINANVYLDALDQYIKHGLRCRYYIRYVDDFVLLHQSPQWLNEALAKIEQFLPATLAAQLNPTKTVLQPVDRGIDFVGQVIKPWRRTLRRITLSSGAER